SGWDSHSQNLGKISTYCKWFLPSTGYAIVTARFRVGLPVTTGLDRHTCCGPPFRPITVQNETVRNELVPDDKLENASGAKRAVRHHPRAPHRSHSCVGYRLEPQA